MFFGTFEVNAGSPRKRKSVKTAVRAYLEGAVCCRLDRFLKPKAKDSFRRDIERLKRAKAGLRNWLRVFCVLLRLFAAFFERWKLKRRRGFDWRAFGIAKDVQIWHRFHFRLLHALQSFLRLRSFLAILPIVSNALVLPLKTKTAFLMANWNRGFEFRSLWQDRRAALSIPGLRNNDWI